MKQNAVTIRAATRDDVSMLLPLVRAYRIFYEQQADEERERAFSTGICKTARPSCIWRRLAAKPRDSSSFSKRIPPCIFRVRGSSKISSLHKSIVLAASAAGCWIARKIMRWRTAQAACF